MTVEVNGIAAVGDVLARKYRVDKILGVGGMGMVVAATHLELDQRVALKFMLPSTHESPETPARFLREARAAGRLNSDHVCRVIDVGRFDGGTPYIVMEYLQGEDLGALLRRRGPLRVSEAVGFILQAIEGIAEAHANGIIHRDLKPDNLFLHKRNDGASIVKVLDFGISKAKAAGLSTKTGDIFGSPAYMAPEQMESSRSVDHRADVWSLGIVLYQLVVGKPPFQGDSLPLLCMSVVNDEPKPMSEIRGDLPEGFEAAVMKCLRKEPVDRYADVGELAHALAPFGPKNATTSASRIQIVLRRTHCDSASVISTEFSTVERDDPSVPRTRDTPVLQAARSQGGAGAPGDSSAVRRAASGDSSGVRRAAASGDSSGVPAYSFGAGLSSGLRIGSTGQRKSRRLIGALVAAIVAVSVAILVVWRSGSTQGAPRIDPRAQAQPTAATASPVVAPAVAPAAAAAKPRPIVEPIEEPKAAVATPPAADGPATPSPKAEGKKRRPHRPAAAAKRAPAAAAPVESKSGSNAGSAATPDDDKWMHMTHDDKKP
ncbi:MAG TPA: serine/threonine-protein kinase [Kofleriaceae bacterium]|nr:serine/threonine-protein kinase [Kofleriaceae bacterium]